MEPLRIHTASVAPGWIDYNNHMNEGYYGVAFGDASDALLEHCGFGSDYRVNVRGAFYTVESHIRFLKELDLGDPIAFDSIVLGVDARRVHVFHEMKHGGTGDLAATQEVMMLHVDRDTVRVTAMADALLDTLRAVAERHAAIPTPDGVGATVRSLR